MFLTLFFLRYDFSSQLTISVFKTRFEDLFMETESGGAIFCSNPLSNINASSNQFIRCSSEASTITPTRSHSGFHDYVTGGALFFIGNSSVLQYCYFSECTGRFYGQAFYIYQESSKKCFYNCSSMSMCTKYTDYGAEFQIDRTKVFCTDINSSNINNGPYHVAAAISYIDNEVVFRFYTAANCHGAIICSIYPLYSPGSSSYFNFFNNSASIGHIDNVVSHHSYYHVSMLKNTGNIVSSRWYVLSLHYCTSDTPYSGPDVAQYNCVYNINSNTLIPIENTCFYSVINTDFQSYTLHKLYLGLLTLIYTL